MIYLVKNQQNTVVLTLNEKASSSTYDVLFMFEGDITGEKIYFTSSDTSLTPARFNEFIIEETSSVNYYQGKIELSEGTYSYVAYEMPVASPKSINPDDIVQELESGKVTVELSDDTKYLNNDTKDNKIFE